MSSDGPEGNHPTPQPDPAEILAAVGEALYVWDIAADVLSWSATASVVLGIADAAVLATGRGYAQVLEPGNAQARFDAIVRSDRRDDGKGVPYRIVYGLRPVAGAETQWIEDVGRWFAGSDG